MLPSWLIVVLIVDALICGLYCSVIAKNKGYDGLAWLFGGLLFGIIALISVVAMPMTPEKVFERKKRIETLSKREKLTTAEIEMLKQSCQKMPEKELVGMLLEGEANYKEGIYELLLKEAYKRGIRQKIRGEEIEDLIKRQQNGTQE